MTEQIKSYIIVIRIILDILIHMALPAIDR